MSFKLRIRGRDHFEPSTAANPANPLMQLEQKTALSTVAANDATGQDLTQNTISRLAELAGHDVSIAEVKRFDKRVSRISWLGYGDDADNLGVMLLHRDQQKDDRRLCVECHHAGPGWRCAKREAFLVRQLQRCDHFTGVN